MIQLIKSSVPIQFLLGFLFLMVSDVSGQVVINEFVIDGSPEWVELYNASSSADYLKAYWIDDDTNFLSDAGNSSKKSLSNLNITNINFPFIELSSSIFNNNDPDSVVLFDNSGNLIDQYPYTSNPGNEVSIGRSPDFSGSFFILASVTKGSANSLPMPSPSPSPTSTPTTAPTATSAPTPTPTKTPSPTPLKTSTAKPISSPEVLAVGTSSDSYVLGLRDQLMTSEPTSSSEATSKNLPILPIVLIVTGIACMAGASFAFFKKVKTGYTDTYENESGKDS